MAFIYGDLIVAIVSRVFSFVRRLLGIPVTHINPEERQTISAGKSKAWDFTIDTECEVEIEVVSRNRVTIDVLILPKDELENYLNGEQFIYHAGQEHVTACVGTDEISEAGEYCLAVTPQEDKDAEVDIDVKVK